ncbi:hypothetical protein PSENEW3_00001489 [Picochlorum sp. SENEW3]|nr:hypothetical protein PSENEW3_00001489 [Picochlorum sp. SENEW3]
MKYIQCIFSLLIVLATAGRFVYGAECSQQIGGVCYSCPDGYPNNLLDNGECFCTNDANERVACIKDATSTVTGEDGIAGEVETSGALAMSAAACLFALVTSLW